MTRAACASASISAAPSPDIVVQRHDGVLLVNKTSSTPHDLSEAVIAGLQSALAEAGVRPADVVEIVHGHQRSPRTPCCRNRAPAPAC
ncbi:MAG: hypothetical protein WDO24_22370 [Pseudomonadota bacterium]